MNTRDSLADIRRELRLMNDVLRQLLDVVQTRNILTPSAGEVDVLDTLKRFDSRRHAVLQMLLASRENAEIAKRLNSNLSTTKMHVRTICQALNVKTRLQVYDLVIPVFNALPENTYLQLSGGLPKDWERTYRDIPESDVFKSLYQYEDERT